MAIVHPNVLKTPIALMATLATTVAGERQNTKISACISKGALRMRVDAQTITSVLVLILFVTSLPATTASSVTFHQKTA